jgi:hypothetical protein
MSSTVNAWPAREIDSSSFADLFPNVVESIEWPGDEEGNHYDNMYVTFEGELTDNQEYLARRRIRTTPDGEQREIQAINAYQSIQNYRNITNPTAAQTTAQVKLQAQVIQGLIIMAFPDASRDLGVTF